MRDEITATVKLTPEIVAEWFAGAYDDEQALALSLIEDHMNSLGAHKRDTQLIYLSAKCDTRARNFIFRMANWFKARGLGGKQWEDAIEHYPEG